MRIGGDKPEWNLQDIIKSNRHPRYETEGKNRNASGTSINQNHHTIQLIQSEYMILESSSPTAKFCIKYHHQIRQQGSTDESKKKKRYPSERAWTSCRSAKGQLLKGGKEAGLNNSNGPQLNGTEPTLMRKPHLSQEKPARYCSGPHPLPGYCEAPATNS